MSLIGEFVETFPGISVKILRTLQEESWSASEWQMTGTHKGPLTGPDGKAIAATNKRIEFSGADFYRTNVFGQVVEERRYFDTAAMATQPGLGS